MVACHPTCCLCKVGNASSFFTFLEVIGNGDEAVGGDTRRPKVVVNRDGCKGNLAESVANVLGHRDAVGWVSQFSENHPGSFGLPGWGRVNLFLHGRLEVGGA